MWSGVVSWIRGAYETLVSAAGSFGTNRGNRMAAAISYRTIFALAPLLVIAVAIFGLVVGGSEEARQAMLDAIEGFAGAQVAQAVDMLMLSATDTGAATATLGFLLFVWTSSTLFLELQNSLNDVFGVPYEETAGFRGFVRKRVVGFVWVIGIGLLVVAIWLINVAWVWIASLFPSNLEWLRSLFAWAAPFIALILFPFAFALVFRTMVTIPIHWRAIWMGGLFTSAVFVATAIGARIYFSWDSDTSASQLAAGFFVLLLLAFFLASAFVFGAHMTKIYHDRIDASEAPESG